MVEQTQTYRTIKAHVPVPPLSELAEAPCREWLDKCRKVLAGQMAVDDRADLEKTTKAFEGRLAQIEAAKPKDNPKRA